MFLNYLKWVPGRSRKTHSVGVLAVISLAATLALPISAVAGAVQDIPRLAAALASPDVSERDAAEDAISGIALADPQSVDTLLAAFLASSSPEARFRLRRILEEFVGLYFFNSKKGFVGIGLAPHGADLTWAGKNYSPPIIVSTVIDGFPAQAAGVKADDLVLEVDGIQCGAGFGVEGFIEHISGRKPGDPVVLLLYTPSAGKARSVTLKLGERPGENGGLSEPARRAKYFQKWLASKIRKAEPAAR